MRYLRIGFEPIKIGLQRFTTKICFPRIFKLLHFLLPITTIPVHHIFFKEARFGSNNHLTNTLLSHNLHWSLVRDPSLVTTA